MSDRRRACLLVLRLDLSGLNMNPSGSCGRCHGSKEPGGHAQRPGASTLDLINMDGCMQIEVGSLDRQALFPVVETNVVQYRDGVPHLDNRVRQLERRGQFLGFNGDVF